MNDSEIVREALGYGRLQHNELSGDGPNRGHACSGCNRFTYAVHALARLEAQAARVEQLEEALNVARVYLGSIVELDASDHAVKSVIEHALSSIPSQEERA